MLFHGGGRGGPPGPFSAAIAELLGLLFIWSAVSPSEEAARRGESEVGGRVVRFCVGAFVCYWAFTEFGKYPNGQTFRLAIPILFGAAVIVSSVAKWWWWKGSESWPVASARVESVGVEEVDRKGGPVYVVEIEYSFPTSDGRHSGGLRREFATQEEADQFADHHQRKREIFVRYNPQHPRRSRVAENR